MHRFLVIESRRLLPLLFLFVLLVSLSIYDNFFRADRAVITPVTDPENALVFVTAGKGEVAAESKFQVIETFEQWQDLQEQYLVLPDYPFNADYELAVSAVHGEIKNIGIFPQEEGLVQVRVQVSPQPQSYHVVTVEREKIGTKSVWQFVDPGNQVLTELTVPMIADLETKDEEESD